MNKESASGWNGNGFRGSPARAIELWRMPDKMRSICQERISLPGSRILNLEVMEDGDSCICLEKGPLNPAQSDNLDVAEASNLWYSHNFDVDHSPTIPAALVAQDSIDVAICSNFQDLIRPSDVLRGLYHIIRPGGLLLLLLHCRKLKKGRDPSHAMTHDRDSTETKKKIIACIDAAGFRVVEDDTMDDGGFCSKIDTHGERSNSRVSECNGESHRSEGQWCCSAYVAAKRVFDVSKHSWNINFQNESTIINSTRTEEGSRCTDSEESVRQDTSTVINMSRSMRLGMYMDCARDARDLGIPASAIPALPSSATAEDILHAQMHLEAMICSFLSAGL